jgi:YggT family protein
VASFLAQLLQLYVFAIFGRIILSWFPIEPGGAMATIFSVLYRITEPVLGPVRRILPPMGGFDISPIIVILALELIGGSIVNSLR